MPSNPKDFLSGVFFVGVAGVFAFSVSGLPIGSSTRMGPGYFPLILTGALALLGVVLIVRGLRTRDTAPTPVHWRALLLIVGAAVVFGVVVRPLGFLPAVGLTVLLATLASMRYGPATSITVTAVLVVFCWLVFSLGLGLPWPLLGHWLS